MPCLLVCGSDVVREVNDELGESDGQQQQWRAPLRQEPRHRGLLEQLLQYQGSVLPPGTSLRYAHGCFSQNNTTDSKPSRLVASVKCT